MAYGGWIPGHMLHEIPNGYEFGAFRGHYYGPKNHYFLATLGGQVEKYRHVEWQEYQEVAITGPSAWEWRAKPLYSELEDGSPHHPDSADYFIEFVSFEVWKSLQLTGHVAAWARAGDGYIVEYWRL